MQPRQWGRLAGSAWLGILVIGTGVFAGKVHVIEPDDKATKKAQTALIKAKPGDVVEFAEGTFEITGQLSLLNPGVTVRGKGADKTILSYKNATGAEGLLVKANDFTIEDLAVEDTRGDAIKVEGGQNVVFRRVRVEWTGEASEKNGAYGLYPVQCTNVLIEECTAIGASDAGIYVGQSENVVVRRSRAERNVAGIEIENTLRADVYENVATNNAGGLLVFDLPGLQRVNGGKVRVFNNQVFDNNHVNFAPKGNIVASVPPGTGLMLMATDEVQVYQNTIRNNQTTNLSIISFLAVGKKFDTKNGYDPYAESIYIYDNVFEGGGENPDGRLGKMLSLLLGKPMPDIVYDGVTDPNKYRDGALPEELTLKIRNNGEATFANAMLAGLVDSIENIEVAKILSHRNVVERDVSKYEGSHPPLPAVELSLDGGN